MKTGLSQGRTRRWRGSVAAAGFVLIAAPLSGCMKNEVVTGSLPTDGYRTAYPIVVTEAPETLDIPVGSGSGGLQPGLKAAIRDFGREAARDATGSLVILAPVGSANETVASYLARDMAREARAGGMPEALVEVRGYQVQNPRVLAPIRLSYDRIKAVSPPCGRWTGSIMPSHDKLDDGAEFGCSTQANLAAMIENPQDLISPRAATATPLWQRWIAIAKWGGGESPNNTWELADTAVGEE